MRRGDVTGARRRPRRRARARRYDRRAHVEAAALGRLGDSLAAQRSLGVAGFGSGRAKPAMRRGEQEEAR